MPAYELTSAAEADAAEILLYLAEKAGEAVALRHLDRFSAAFDMLGRFPGVGHPRPDCQRPILFWAVGSYLIAYRPQLRPIRIIAVLHGARELSGLLADRG